MMNNDFVKSICIRMLSGKFSNMDFIGILEIKYAEIVFTVIVFVHKDLGTLP